MKEGENKSYVAMISRRLEKEINVSCCDDQLTQ